ncbi:MAG: hypothetical protein GF416_07580 [Candidatus Altiarchaeales archaeon]|nr:hypothetical protein [Candidatus Altiarchaeales archaeon]MBD3416972.1 hypothetical protein [Candidatus Altiarchaeales archaeon]
MTGRKAFRGYRYRRERGVGVYQPLERLGPEDDFDLLGVSDGFPQILGVNGKSPYKGPKMGPEWINVMKTRRGCLECAVTPKPTVLMAEVKDGRLVQGVYEQSGDKFFDAETGKTYRITGEHEEVFVNDVLRDGQVKRDYVDENGGRVCLGRRKDGRAVKLGLEEVREHVEGGSSRMRRRQALLYDIMKRVRVRVEVQRKNDGGEPEVIETRHLTPMRRRDERVTVNFRADAGGEVNRDVRAVSGILNAPTPWEMHERIMKLRGGEARVVGNLLEAIQGWADLGGLVENSRVVSQYRGILGKRSS